MSDTHQEAETPSDDSVPSERDDAASEPDGTDSQQQPRRRRWVRIGVAVGVAAAIIGAVAGVSAWMLYSKLGQISVVQAPTTEVADGVDAQPLNILLMGSDTRTGKGNRRYGLDAGRGGERSDTTILLHVAADRSRALAVSIPRDLWVEQPDCALADGQYPYYAKFNNAFDAGGPACTTELVTDMTGVPIHHIAVVDFQGFKQVVDALGGVEVCLTEAVDDPAAKLQLPAGRSVVTGEDALAFVRARKYIGDGSDISRIERQQAFLSSAIRKATDTGMLLNPAKLYSVLDTATKALTVDQSLDQVSEMTDLALGMRTLTPEKITFTTMPFVYRSDGANVDPVPDKAEALWRAMLDDTPWPAPASVGQDGQKLTVAPADITVDVAGPAAKLDRVAGGLRRAGFIVGGLTPAKARALTRVVHSDDFADSARTVAFATGANVATDPGAWRVRLELGRDFAGVEDQIVIAKQRKAAASSSYGGQVSRADKEVCSS
jgi:LCP family protein required for cell wall assembly